MAIGAIAGIIGAIGGDIGSSVYEADQARKSSHEQMDFQREMSNTAYQRAVKDMSAAGLSPMLAYSQGGASSPSGAARQVVDMPNLGNSALAAAQQVANIEKTGADTELSRAQANAANTSAEATQKQVLDVIEAVQTRIRAEGDTARWKELLAWLEAAKARIAFTGEGTAPGESIDSGFRGVFKRSGLDIGNVFDHVALELRKKQAEAGIAEKESTLRGLQIPEAKAGADFYKDTGEYAKWVKELGPGAANILRLIMQMIGGRK